MTNTARRRTLRIRGACLVMATLAAGSLVVGSPSRAAEPDQLTVPGEKARGPIRSVDARFADTRPGASTFDGAGSGTGRLRAGELLDVMVTGRAGIASDSASALVNIIAVAPSAPGFLTVFDCAGSLPKTSNVNFAAGQTIANSAVVGLTSGSVCVYSPVDTDVVLDVIGTFDTPVSAPSRIVDTRIALGGQRLAAGAPFEIELERLESQTAIVNVTVTNSATAGWLKQCDDDFAPSSSINFAAGQTIANMVVLPADSACLTASTDVDIVVDLLARPLGVPIMVTGQPPLDLPQSAWKLRIPDRFDSREDGAFPPSLVAGVPAVVATFLFESDDVTTSRLLNIVVVNPSTAGYIVAYGCESESTPPPKNLSSLNFGGGDVVAHLSTVNRTEGERICLMSSADTEVVVDDVGRIEPEIEVALRSFDYCSEIESTADGQGPFFGLSPTSGGAWSDSEQFVAIGTDGPFDITANGPAGWLVTLEQDDTDANRFSWRVEVPSGSSAGTFPVSMTTISASGTSFTLTSTVSFDPDGPPVVPVIC